MEVKTVWLVETNTDLTEGRGSRVREAFCEEYATARRLGKGKYVQGGDCPISRCEVFKPEGKVIWFGPIDVVPPTDQDRKNQDVLDAQLAAIEKAESLGLSAAEINLIRISTKT